MVKVHQIQDTESSLYRGSLACIVYAYKYHGMQIIVQQSVSIVLANL